MMLNADLWATIESLRVVRITRIVFTPTVTLKIIKPRAVIDVS